MQRRVVKTKSVEYMPFSLSLSLTLCAATWFFYGFFSKDYYIMVPNVVGFMFGVAQMVLYFLYMDCNNINKDKPQFKSTPSHSHHEPNFINMQPLQLHPDIA